MFLVNVHSFVYLVCLSVIWVMIHPRMVPTGWEDSVFFFHLKKEKGNPLVSGFFRLRTSTCVQTQLQDTRTHSPAPINFPCGVNKGYQELH